MGRRAVLFLCLLVAACASARTGGGSALYRREVGNATPSDAMRIGLRIVQQFQYEVFQVDTITELNILTHWKPRRPLADELALGVTSAESRLNIIGRLLGQNDICRFYNILLTLENRLRVPGSADCYLSPNTSLFTQHGE